MTEREPFATSGGVETAIKEAARKAAASDPSFDVSKRITLEHFNRFLSRVFSEGENSKWVLKGGTSILARIPSSRSTRDIDLLCTNFTLARALEELIRLASTDLNDHFRFEYVNHRDSIGNDAHPYIEGYRVTFNVFIGLAPKGTLQVDLAVGAAMTDDVVTIAPATNLDLPRLTSNPYRLYPAVDQIADKVCATVTAYREKASSREKDLVDLVVFAVTQDFDGTALRIAIATELHRRKIVPFEHFTVPTAWGAGYARLNKSVSYCASYRTVELASDLVARLIDPALTRDADGKTWSHTSLDWAK